MPKKKANITLRKFPQNLGDFTDDAAFAYFKRLTQGHKSDVRLSPRERSQRLDALRRRTILLSALYGALGVLLLYIPQYMFPEFFKGKDFAIPFTKFSVEISWTEFFYGIVLVAIEIYLLTLLDIKAVSGVAVLFGFPPDQPFDAMDTEGKELIYIGLGKEKKKFSEIGINPFQKMSKAGMFALLLFFRFKAFASNFVFRILVKRILGRFALREVVDLAAVPIYAFWNAYASAVVFRKIKMRMMTDDMMRTSGLLFYQRFSHNGEFKSLIYDSLEYIAITKKTYHATDYIYAKHLLTMFGIPPKAEHQISENYFEKLVAASPDVREGIGQLLIIGFVIDGKIGTLEHRIIHKLQDAGVIDYNFEQIAHSTRLYVSGHGFYDFLTTNSKQWTVNSEQ